MKQEDRELLLKDLCARLPYGVKAQVKYPINTNDECIITTKEITSVNCGLDIVQAENLDIIVGYYTFEVKPYLFPLSSMTEEQYKTYCELEHSGNMEHLSLPLLNWLLKNHFDVYGLIPMGLALDATGLGIY